jgi:hypothetical protein
MMYVRLRAIYLARSVTKASITNVMYVDDMELVTVMCNRINKVVKKGKEKDANEEVNVKQHSLNHVFNCPCWRKYRHCDKWQLFPASWIRCDVIEEVPAKQHCTTSHESHDFNSGCSS